MNGVKFFNGPITEEQAQSLMICAKLGHTTTPAVLISLLEERNNQRLRNADLMQALERAKMWVGQCRSWNGNYGTIAEDWLMIVRTLKGLPHPPSEFDIKHTEPGASE